MLIDTANIPQGLAATNCRIFAATVRVYGFSSVGKRMQEDRSDVHSVCDRMVAGAGIVQRSKQILIS